MSNRKSSPFDNFWGFNQREEKNNEEEKTQTNFPEIFQEASKTWKSVSPMIKPMFNRFKK